MLRRLVPCLIAGVVFAATLAYAPPSHAWAKEGAVRASDTLSLEQARQRVSRLAGFPNLRDFQIVDPTVGMKYNCIAHSLGIHSRWVNPQTGPSNNRLMPMDRLYQEKGYTRAASLDFRLVRGMKKVVLYARVSGGPILEVTHAALQESDGSWTSKMGQLPLIRHHSPQDLNGPSYGQPVAVYVKRL